MIFACSRLLIGSSFLVEQLVFGCFCQIKVFFLLKKHMKVSYQIIIPLLLKPAGLALKKFWSWPSLMLCWTYVSIWDMRFFCSTKNCYEVLYKLNYYLKLTLTWGELTLCHSVVCMETQMPSLWTLTTRDYGRVQLGLNMYSAEHVIHGFPVRE